MNIKDFKVGQTVWVELSGYASWGKTAEQLIEEWEITYVGRKYISAGKRHEKLGIVGEVTFEYRDDYNRFVEKTNYRADYILYVTRREIEEEHEKSRLFREIEERFGYGLQRDISLEQLRATHGILEGGNEK